MNIGRGVDIGCDRCLYIMLLITSCIAFDKKIYRALTSWFLITRFIKGCFNIEFIKG